MDRTIHIRWIKEWCSIVLAWVNSLKDGENSYSRLWNVMDSEVLPGLIKQMFLCDGKESSYKDKGKLIEGFMKAYFPDGLKKTKLSLKNEDDVLIFLSLIMYYVCIRFKIKDIHKKNCNFIDSNAQEVLTRFFKKMIEIGEENLTKDCVIDAVKESLEPRVVEPRSPLSPKQSPNCLKEFFDSPILKDRKKKESELKMLKVLLGEEQSEKAELEEKVTCLQDELKKTKVLLNEKIKEIRLMEEENLSQCLNVTLNTVEKENKEKYYHDKNKLLEEELKELKEEIDSLIELRDRNIDQISELSKKVINQDESLREQFKRSQDDQFNIVQLQNENCGLAGRIKELEQTVEALKEQTSPAAGDERNISCPLLEENCGQVIDLQLLEKEELIEQLKSQITAYEVACKEKENEIKQLEGIKIDTEKRLLSKCNEITCLNKMCSELQEKISSVNDELKLYKEQNHLLTTKNNKLDFELTGTIKEANELKSQLGECNETINEMNDIIHKKECKEKNLLSDLNNLENQIKQLKENEVDMENNLLSKTDVIEVLNKTCDEFQERLLNIGAELQLSKEQYENITIRNNQLECDLTASIEEANRIKHKLMDSERSISEMKDLISDKECKEITLLSDINCLSDQIKKCDNIIVGLETKLSSKNDEVDVLNETLSKVRDELEFSKRENESKGDEICKLTSELSAIVSQTNDLKQEVTEFTNKVHQLNSVVIKKEAEEKKYHSAIKNLDDQIKILNNLRVELEGKLDAKNNEVNVSNENLIELQEQLSSLSVKLELSEQENENKVTEINYLNCELAASVSKINNLELEVVNYTKNVQELNGLISVKIDEEKKYCSTIMSMDEQIKKLDIMRREFEEKLNYKQKEVEALNVNLIKLQDQHSSSIAELELAKQENETKSRYINKLDSELTASVLKSNDLKIELGECNKTIQELHAVISIKEAEEKKCSSTIKCLDDQIRELLSIKGNLEEKLCSANNEIEILNETLMKLKDQISSSTAELETSKEENDIKEEEIARLNSQLAAAASETSELKGEVTECNKKIQELSEVVLAKEAEKNKNLSTISCLGDEIKKLVEIKGELEEKLCFGNNEIENLNDTLMKLKDQLNSSTAELESSRQENDTKIDEIKKLNSELIAAISETSSLKQEMAECNKKIEELTEVISAKEAEETKNQSAIKCMDNEIKELVNIKREFEEKLCSANNEIETLNETLKTLKDQLNSSTAELESSRQENDIKLDEIAKLNSELTAAISETSRLKQEGEERNEKIQKLTEVVSAKEAEETKHQSTIKCLGDQIKELVQMRGELEDQLFSADSEIGTLNETLIELKDQLNSSTTELESSRQENNIKVVENEKLYSELTVTISERSTLKREVAECNKKIQELTEVVSAKEAEYSKNQFTIKCLDNEIKELVNAKSEFEEKLCSANNEIETLNGTLKTLKDQLNSSTAELESSRQENDIKSDEIGKLNSELTAAISETNSLKQQVADCNKKIEELTEGVSAKEAEESKNQSTIKCMGDQIKEFVKMNEEYKEKLDSKINEVNVLNITLDKLQEEMSSSKAALDMFQNENDTKIAELNHLNSELTTAVSKANDLELKLAESNKKVQELNDLILVGKIKEKECQSGLHNSIISLESEIKQLKEEAETKATYIITLEENCMKLNQENVNVSDLLQKSQTECKVILEENTHLSSQLSSLTATATHLENIIQEDDFKIKHLQSMVLKHENVDQDLNKTIECLKKEISSLQEETIKKDTILEHQNKDLNKMNNKIESLKEHLDRLISKNEELNKDLLLKSKENQGKSSHIASLECHLQEMHEKEANKEAAEKKPSEFELDNDALKFLREENKHLKSDYIRITNELNGLSTKNESLTAEINNMAARYDAKLNKMKICMKDVYTKAMMQKDEECEKKTRQLQEVIKSNELHSSQLSSQLWDTSDKLITIKKENEELRSILGGFKKVVPQQNVSMGSRRSLSYEHIAPSHSALDMEQTLTVTRRQSVRAVPSGMGKVFPSEDEAEEMFNNECLADLKAGRCLVNNDPDRVSTLKYRNSLCPPHLKSSYPAETQFLPMEACREDDIKGKAGDSENSQSLLPDKQRRKDRSQTLELKPVVTPRGTLRELNDGQKKPSTPSRLFSHLFTGRHRDENTPTSTQRLPATRRLSLFSKRK